MKNLFFVISFLMVIHQSHAQFEPVDDAHLYWENIIYIQVDPDSDIKLAPYNVAYKNNYSSGIEALDRIMASGEVSLLQPMLSGLKSIALQNTYRLEIENGAKNLLNFIHQLNKSELIIYAERMPKNYPMLVPNDANFDQLWFMGPIEACEAWDIVEPKKDIVVAVVDDAILWNHEDLQDNLWVNTAESNGTSGVDDDNNGVIDDIIGFDMASMDSNPAPPGNATADYFSHGTHVAGTVGAVSNNGRGISSIALNTAKIMSCKGARDTDAAYSQIWEALSYAIVMGADVINNSWGRGVDSNGNPPPPLAQTERALLEEAANRDIIVLFSAGNNNDQIALPASSDLVISVAATGNPLTGQIDEKAYYSNYGPWVDISAPGSQIYSTVPGDEKYVNQQGTSMATPNVASLLALMKSHAPDLSNDQIINCLFNSADDISSSNPDFDGLLGAGRINARKAIECVSQVDEVCDAPSALSVESISETTAELNWEAAPNASAYFVEIRNLGDAQWFSFPNNPFSSLSLNITGLSACRKYEFRVKSMCDNSTSLYSQIFSFETTCDNMNACDIPIGLFVNNITDERATLRWSSVTEADSYSIRARQVNASSWVEVSDVTALQIDYTGLSECTEYEFQVAAVCNGEASAFSSSFLFMSGGCASDCNPVENITISQIGEEEAMFDWASVPASLSYELRYKHDATNTWQTLSTTISQATVNDLISCRTYEVQVLNICSDGVSDYSASQFFETDCPDCESPDLSSTQALAITDDKATIIWNTISTALAYEVQARAVGSSDWVTGEVQTNGVLYSGLESCQEYELQLRSLCDNDQSDFGQAIRFTTRGCNGDPSCISYGDNGRDEWIDEVIIGDITNVSGSNYGYAFFDDWEDTRFEAGASYSLRLKPGYNDSEFEEYWRIWIDLNRDNDFDDIGELIYESGNGVIGQINADFVMPTNLTDGASYVRVSMKYINDETSPQTSCENFGFGEVEDYSITLSSTVSAIEIDPAQISIVPNPNNGKFKISQLQPNSLCMIYSSQGKIIEQWKNLSDTKVIDLSTAPDGIYLLRSYSESGNQDVHKIIKH